MLKFILVLILIQGFSIVYSLCPTGCNCTKHLKPQAEWLKVVCKEGVEDINNIDFSPVLVEMIHLDLSKNQIQVISTDSFKNFTNLKRLNLSANKIKILAERDFEGLMNLDRLDLSKNLIESIDPHAFRRLPNLKRLDLSTNKISVLDMTVFHGLLALDRLKLSGNKLETLKEGIFHGLQSLRQLEVSANPWKCDCKLFWFSYWIQNTSIKFNTQPECDQPISMKGKLVKKLKVLKEAECIWATPSIEIVPDQNQVVFAGDKITLKCRAPSITNDKYAQLNWLWHSNVTADLIDLELYNDPQSNFNDVRIENRYLEDSGIVASSLNINPVKQAHNGQWNCFLFSAYGNISRSINVIVISNSTKYCPLTVTKSNKGVYAWPRTVIGWKVELPCEGNSGTVGSFLSNPRASYQCNTTGHWEHLNIDNCPYILATTKILEQFSTVNISFTKLSLPKGSLLETFKKLKNITGEGASLTDPVEVHFVTKTLENYANNLVEEKELGAMLIDVVNILLNLPKAMLKEAEIQYGACTRLLKTVELIVEATPPNQLIQLHKKNMALEEYRIKPETFAGLTCTWYTNTDESNKKLLHCSMNNKTSFINTNSGETTIEASIQLPATLFHNIRGNGNTYLLMISMYADNKLLPNIYDHDNTDITSSIAGSKLIGASYENITEPIYVMMKAPLIHYSTSKPIPVVWDPALNNNTGGWSKEGCQLSNFINNLIIFNCNRLGYYGLLQDKSFLDRDGKTLAGAKFKFSNPAIYVGSFVLLACLICTTVTYVCCYASIAMPKKAKHCIINTWVSITLLCFLYSSGIHQTENIEICQGVGISLHYLSLCSLFWMTASASNMYKRLSKTVPDPITDDDELREQPIRKPILGLYLVGWGISMIICGISGAINMREYASYSHCFLSSTPTLASLLVPAAILLVYLIILHMMIRCTIRNADLNGQLSEGTQATENVDLELLEPTPNSVADRVSLHSSQTVSSEVEDQEHSQITQLKGLIVVMILYLLTWLCAAMTTTNLLTIYIPYKETVFAIFYAVSASSLGLFILLFYGIARSDVRTHWLQMRCWFKQKKNRCCRTRNITDTNPTIPTQSLVPLNAAPVMINSLVTQITSDTNSLGSSRHTQKSHSSCNTTKLTPNEVTARCQIKPNIIVLHRQLYRSNNSVTTYNTESAPATVEMFYNPQQSVTARRFFKRQRRNMHKNSNLGPRKQGDGGANSDNGSIPRRSVKLDNDIEKSILGSSSKVNNTNIHVEMNRINDAKNINMLSDSGGSAAEDRNLSLRYVIGQESIDKNSRKVNNELPVMSNEISHKKCQRGNDTAPHTNLYGFSANGEKIEGKKNEIQNPSQQCTLESDSEIEAAVQETISERSEQDPSEISETTTSRLSADIIKGRRFSVDEPLSSERKQRISGHRYHSGSLSSLPMADRSLSSRSKSSYRSSLNDTASLDDFHREREESITTATAESFNNIERRLQHNRLLSFPAVETALTYSEAKFISSDEEENDCMREDQQNSSNTVKAVITLAEASKGMAVEALPLCEFSEREGTLHQHKQYQANSNKEYNREIKDFLDETAEEQSSQTKMMNVKKETSV